MKLTESKILQIKKEYENFGSSRLTKRGMTGLRGVAAKYRVYGKKNIAELKAIAKKERWVPAPLKRKKQIRVIRKEIEEIIGKLKGMDMEMFNEAAVRVWNCLYDLNISLTTGKRLKT